MKNAFTKKKKKRQEERKTDFFQTHSHMFSMAKENKKVIHFFLNFPKMGRIKCTATNIESKMGLK